VSQKFNSAINTLVIGTGDKTFSIGDVNNDGKVNKTDRTLISGALGMTDDDSLAVYDLNGDGKIDIIDLAYVNHQIGAEGDARIFDTSLIAGGIVQLDKITENVNVSGDIENIFNTGNISAVTLSPKNEDSGIALPVEFGKEAETEQIEIISPSVTGAIVSGSAMVTYIEKGKEITEEIPFDSSHPESIELLEASEGTSSVVISLGKRVAVKKVVINVTKVEGEDGKPSFAVVREIKFLKDIVPENPALQSLSVKNVRAEAKNESILLKWDEFPNVTGYTVYYGRQNGVYTSQVTVDTNSALITGLKNLTTYFFTVVPVSDGWEGAKSDVISAMPMPSEKPLKPNMIVIKPMDGALSVSWKETENATYYKVFYKENGAKDFIRFGDKITSTSVSVGNLTNDTEYVLYVVAGNDIGESPDSDLAYGVPKKTIIEAPDIPTFNMIDGSNIEKVEMQNYNNVLQSEYPEGFDVRNVADGDYSTHWTARAFWESNQFIFTFKEAKEMNYMVYVPRLDGDYRRSLEKYSITVWDEEGHEKIVADSKTITVNSNETGYMILPFERTKVKKLAVSVAQWAGSPTGVSLSEAIFYESDNLASDIRELFANDTYTELSESAKSDISAARKKTASLRAQANDANGYYVDKSVLLDELDLAEGLLDGTDALGYIKTGVQSRSVSADRIKYAQSGSDFQPIGAVAYASEYAGKQGLKQTTVTIYAHIPEGEKAYIVPTQYYAEANAWQGNAVEIQNGRNIIEIPKLGTQTSERGGALYLRYSGKHPEEVSLHIRQGITRIPMLELSDWYSVGENEKKERIRKYVESLEIHVNNLNKQNVDLRIFNSTEISMPNVLLSLPADKVLAGIKPTGADNSAAEQTLYNNVLAWEDLMHIVNTTQGIDNTLEKSDMQSRQNIRYMRMFSNAFMYAAGTHIGIGYGSAASMVCGKPVSMLEEGASANNIFGWGIAHEIGHNMDKLGKAEITNNIYSLMVQTYDGNRNTLKSRLETDDKYQRIYEKVSAGYPGMSNDVFTQLGIYWQLHLAYDDGENPMDFYNRFFKEWKKDESEGVSGDERFALIAAETANRNLTEFFESWGMKLSDDVKAAMSEYPEETRKIQYLNDDSRRYRLNGGKAGVGITEANAEIDDVDEKRVNLTFSSSADGGSVLGYEIIRNGVVIAFTQSNEYTDIIGSANNKAFSYEVRAIDMLGNEIGAAADAGQVRISYLKTIDPQRYTMTRNSDGTVSVLFDDRTAVSGIKVT
ncbi:MAG: M60 family metallopeptidase, partial [Oscillospiraceae bacterium]|nr:M60 family metallopeptidase [Oscillospiraceae bacterium]